VLVVRTEENEAASARSSRRRRADRRSREASWQPASGGSGLMTRPWPEWTQAGATVRATSTSSSVRSSPPRCRPPLTSRWSTTRCRPTRALPARGRRPGAAATSLRPRPWSQPRAAAAREGPRGGRAGARRGQRTSRSRPSS
jgi:hypothetical protein